MVHIGQVSTHSLNALAALQKPGFFLHHICCPPEPEVLAGKLMWKVLSSLKVEGILICYVIKPTQKDWNDVE